MPESSTESIARRLSQYPNQAFEFFSAGFLAVSRLPKDVLSRVLQAVIDEIKRGKRGLNPSSIRPLTTLSEQEADQVASVFSVVIGLLSESEATPDEFVSATKGKLFNPEQESTAKSVAVSICAARQEISSALARAQLAGQILPSLEGFYVAVDMRVRVVDGELKAAVPVAVVSIDTDTADNYFLQLTKGEVEDTIKKLSQALEDMKFIETLTFRKS
jgi:hypothetical protein